MIIYQFFLPICLDKSMYIWFQQWTCPGWMFFPRKPHPFGNQYHTACCGLSGILFFMEMVEGKDWLPQLGAPELSVRVVGKLVVYCGIC